MTMPRKWDLTIHSVEPAGEDFCWIRLDAPPEWESLPGQFVNILCSESAADSAERVLNYADDGPRPQLAGAETLRTSPLVRRPVSIADINEYVAEDDDTGREIVLLVRTVGPGSRYLGSRRPGETLDVVGPLGNGFDLDVPQQRAFLVGGGCGVAPLVGLARRLAQAGKDVTVFYGCADAATIPLRLPDDRSTAARGFEGTVQGLPDVRVVVATEDGSVGHKGLVTDAMTAYASAIGWQDVALFACGPDVMMSAVAALAQAHGVARCQVSLENYMGCAIGVCLSCAARIREDSPQGWTYKLVCQDGPVFEASQVIFESKWEGCKR